MRRLRVGVCGGRVIRLGITREGRMSFRRLSFYQRVCRHGFIFPGFVGVDSKGFGEEERKGRQGSFTS